MKLLSCHISGFGKLVNCDFEFSQLHCFLRDNGWGKTTLANFIECMFFGMEAGRNKEVADNTRLKYTPWSGAPYGGTLLFSYKGQEYRIERFFGKTPALDSVKIYDKNRMLCYTFGEKGERLGETVFGLDRESYKKCVYFAQDDEAFDSAMTGTIRQRLIALLGAGENAASQNAVAKLDDAERALRAKRRPGRGKLDEIDEKLAYLNEQRAELYRMENNAQEQSAEALRILSRREELKANIERMDVALEQQSRQNERAAVREAYTEIRSKAEEARAQLAITSAFFGDNNAEEVNADGLTNAVQEYYALQEQIEALLPEIEKTEEAWRNKQAVKAQLDAAQKNLRTHRLLAEEKRKNKELDGRVEEEKSDKKEKSKWEKWQLFLATAVTIGGIALAETLPTLAIVLAIIGGIWLLGNLYLSARPLWAGRKRRDKEDEMDDETATQLAEASEEVALYEKQLSACPPNLKKKIEALKDSLETKRARKDALKTAIENFLGHFAFDAVYDYRTALDDLKEKIQAHTKYTAILQECEEKSKRYAFQDEQTTVYSVQDIDKLKAERSALQIAKEEADGDLARAYANIEDWERRADAVRDALSEEQPLQEEKARLEQRLIAIRSAREFLLRARENMAERYLDPVQKRVGELQTALGFADRYKIRFSGAGELLLEERGVLRSVQFYSTGMNDLLQLCVRLAVSDALAGDEALPLILDDPLVNLDDESTEYAKRLIKAMSKNRQVLYFTCKTERTL